MTRNGWITLGVLVALLIIIIFVFTGVVQAMISGIIDAIFSGGGKPSAFTPSC
jgi:hypothetical protein